MRFVRVLAIIAACGTAPAATGAQTRVLVVSGLGGDAAYSRQFAELAGRLAGAAHDRFGVPDSLIQWFGEDATRSDAHYRGQSTRVNVEAALAQMASRALPGDRMVLVLIGHGAGSDSDTRLSIPGPDLTVADFRRLLEPFGTRPVAVLALMSASGDAVATLSAPNRVVITATRTSYERNEVRFPSLFVKALAEDGADIDKDGRVSLLEAYRYAARETKRSYDDTQRLQTEHAQLDDNGDGRASETPTGRDEGALARRFYLDGAGRAAQTTGDATLAKLYDEQRSLEDQVEALRLSKATVSDAQYYAELERVLVALARTSREIRQREGIK